MTKLEALRAAFDAATGGEWDIRPFGTSHAGAIGCGMELIAMMYNRIEEEADAHFITFTHNLMPALLEAVEFVAQVSRYLKDGEEDEQGKVFVMENDDAVDTLNVTISDARRILEKLK